MMQDGLCCVESAVSLLKSWPLTEVQSRPEVSRCWPLRCHCPLLRLSRSIVDFLSQELFCATFRTSGRAWRYNQESIWSFPEAWKTQCKIETVEVWLICFIPHQFSIEVNPLRKQENIKPFFKKTKRKISLCVVQSSLNLIIIAHKCIHVIFGTDVKADDVYLQKAQC